MDIFSSTWSIAKTESPWLLLLLFLLTELLCFSSSGGSGHQLKANRSQGVTTSLSLPSPDAMWKPREKLRICLVLFDNPGALISCLWTPTSVNTVSSSSCMHVATSPCMCNSTFCLLSTNFHAVSASSSWLNIPNLYRTIPYATSNAFTFMIPYTCGDRNPSRSCKF